MMAEKLNYKNYKYSRLSQLENNKKGPPLELVEEYARFFELDNPGKFDLFFAALESSNEIKFDLSAVDAAWKKEFIRVVTSVVLAKETGEIMEKIIKDKVFKSKYDNLFESWNKLRNGIDNFCKEIQKHPLAYNPSPKTAQPMDELPDTPQDVQAE
jgi:hypothetical protein